MIHIPVKTYPQEGKAAYKRTWKNVEFIRKEKKRIRDLFVERRARVELLADKAAHGNVGDL